MPPKTDLRAALDRRGAADRIAADLRDQIMAGTLDPGDPLREADLASRYAVARNTIREALRLLTSEGLAVHEVHRGVAVRRVEAHEIAELFEVRMLVEGAVQKRVGTLTKEEQARLAELLDASEQAAAGEDFRAVLELNLRFHRALVTLVGNTRLTEVFDGLMGEIRLVLASMEADVAGPWLARNRRLLKLLNGSDPEKFTASVVKYLVIARDDLIGRLPADPAT